MPTTNFAWASVTIIGDGVEKDTSKACDMFLKAAAQGNEEAKAALQKLKP
jgi:TPR repeat protein